MPKGDIIEGTIIASNGKVAEATANALDISACFAGDETVRVSLSAKLWVKLKTELDYGEEQLLNNQLLKGYSQDKLRQTADSGQSLTYLTDSAAYNLMRLALYVVDWNLPNKEGVTVRVPRNLDERVAIMKRLSQPIAGAIQAEIAKLRHEGEEPTEVDADGPDPLGSGSSGLASR